MKTRETRKRRKARKADRLTWVLGALALLLLVAVVALAAALPSDRRSEASLADDQLTATAVAANPIPTFTPMPATPPPCVAPADWITHTVQEGNTLYGLADRFSTDVDSLKRVNCLDGDIIFIGQELRVPGLPTLHTTVISTTTAGQPLPAGSIRVDFPERFLNVALLGSDQQPDRATWRTDAIILLSVDTERNVVRLLSVPRDLWVDIPGHGYDRINTAELWGEIIQPGSGPELVKETIYQNLGIPIHYYVRVDFQGFIKIIDAVGGVDIDVECPVAEMMLEPGIYHMDGKTALKFSRVRTTTSDFDRGRRQRKILMALWQQHLNRDLVAKLPALWVAMGNTFETDLPLDQLISLAYIGLQLKSNQVFNESIGPNEVTDWLSPQGAMVLIPIQDKIQELLADFYGPIDYDFLQRVSQTRVQVLNGSLRDQGEKLAASTLRRAGFKVAGTGLAEQREFAQTQILIYNAQEDVAERVAKKLKVPPEAIQYQTDPAGGPYDVLVIVGADYDPCASRD